MAKKKESSSSPLVEDTMSPAVETHKKSKSHKVADEGASASTSSRLSSQSPSLSKKPLLESPETITKAKQKVAVEKKKSAPSAKESKISTKTAAAKQEASDASEAAVKKPVATKKTAAAKKTPAAKKETAKKVTAKAVEESEAPVAKKASKAAAPKAEETPKKASASKAKAEPKAATPQEELKKNKAVKEAPAPVAAAKPEPKAAAPIKAPSTVPAPKLAPDEIEIRQAYDPKNPPSFVLMQKARLIELRSSLIDSMDGVVKEVLSSRPEGSDGSVGGMHMGDAGSDAYDRDFALSMLSKEQDALHEINEALLRIDQGVYGVCEMSALPINEERLEALPYTRYTREMQEVIEKEQLGGRFKRPVVRSVFGLDEDGDEDEDDDEEGSSSTSASNSDSSLDFGKD